MLLLCMLLLFFRNIITSILSFKVIILSSSLSARGIAVKILAEVTQNGASLSQSLTQQLPALALEQRPLAQEICYGVLRWYYNLNHIAQKLLRKPLKGKKYAIHLLFLIGLYQLIYLRIPEHAVVHETVNETKRLQLAWASGLINALLRNFLRQKDTLLPSNKHFYSVENAALEHPKWLQQQIKTDWEEDWQTIFIANQQHPPLFLRINPLHHSPASYLQYLQKEHIAASICPPPTQQAILLENAIAVQKLPGFQAGWASVQDRAAQLAAHILSPQAGENILDACAAPGGKTAHLLEITPTIQLVSVDKDARRLLKIQENLERLDYHATTIVADLTDTQHSWLADPSLRFDRILLDAPCSATGVIRRHPDIKLLRQQQDIITLQQLQQHILNALWLLLKPKGHLLYATCSILRSENDKQIANFLTHHSDARECQIHADWGRNMPHGRQILPGEQAMDGFYYALLQKIS